jgi:hypothetical protein
VKVWENSLLFLQLHGLQRGFQRLLLLMVQLEVAQSLLLCQLPEQLWLPTDVQLRNLFQLVAFADLVYLALQIATHFLPSLLAKRGRMP